uniref:Notch ligand N-terminal domain-containing protein n=1 Tax=Astyanax mexicanus TaxID=7994 RepID=A0A3B1IMG4_ASTMX
MRMRMRKVWDGGVGSALLLLALAAHAQVLQAVGSFELQIHMWQNSLGILQSGQCCDLQAGGGQRCPPGDQCDTFFRVCLKEYQTRVAPTGSCTFGSGSTPVLGGNSHTVHHHGHEGSEGGRIVIPFKYAWPVSSVLSLFLVAVRPCPWFGLCFGLLVK